MPLHGSDVLRSLFADQINQVIFTPSGGPGWVGDATFGNAMLFDDASSQYLLWSSVPVTAPPFTMTCWAYPDATGAYTAMSMVQSSNKDYYLWGNNDTPHATSRNGATIGDAAATADMSVNAWNHLAGVYESSASRACLVNGANKGTESTTVTNPTISTTRIARRNDTTTWHWSGRLADARIYNRALTDAQAAALYNRKTRWELYQIPRHTWATRWVSAAPAIPIAAIADHHYRTRRA